MALRSRQKFPCRRRSPSVLSLTGSAGYRPAAKSEQPWKDLGFAETWPINPAKPRKMGPFSSRRSLIVLSTHVAAYRRTPSGLDLA